MVLWVLYCRLRVLRHREVRHSTVPDLSAYTGESFEQVLKTEGGDPVRTNQHILRFL